MGVGLRETIFPSYIQDPGVPKKMTKKNPIKTSSLNNNYELIFWLIFNGISKFIFEKSTNLRQEHIYDI